jgi:peptide/nickel transport system permease protein
VSRLRSFFSRPLNAISLVIIASLAIVSLIPVSLLPHAPDEVDLSKRLMPPAWVEEGTSAHPFGADFLGRDMFSRLIFAARYTLGISVSATLLATLVGVMAGSLAGYLGGGTDRVVGRLIDIQLAFPPILLILGFIGVMGAGFWNLIIILGLFNWATFARVVRSSTISLKSRDFVDAARAIGARNTRILSHHILLNQLSTILVLISFTISRVILAESALSYLGWGIQPPRATWGTMVGEARTYILESWWLSLIPGAAITVTGLAFNFLGDAISDEADPVLRSKESLL